MRYGCLCKLPDRMRSREALLYPADRGVKLGKMKRKHPPRLESFAQPFLKQVNAFLNVLFCIPAACECSIRQSFK